jgi:hypothetical protein
MGTYLGTYICSDVHGVTAGLAFDQARLANENVEKIVTSSWSSWFSSVASGVGLLLQVHFVCNTFPKPAFRNSLKLEIILPLVPKPAPKTLPKLSQNSHSFRIPLNKVQPLPKMLQTPSLKVPWDFPTPMPREAAGKGLGKISLHYSY